MRRKGSEKGIIKRVDDGGGMIKREGDGEYLIKKADEEGMIKRGR